MKQNNLMTIALVGVGLIAANKMGLFGNKQTGKNTDDDDTTETPEAKQVDAVIDTEKQNMSVPAAIEAARDIVNNVKDAAVLIKTPDGQQNIAVTSGEKRGLFSRIKAKAEKKEGKKIKFSPARLRELRKKAKQFCSAKPKKQRAKCRKQYIAVNKLQLDKMVI